MTALQDLETTGQDVIVDCGRLGLVGWPETVLAEADLSVMLCRTHLPAIAATRSWAETVLRGHPAWASPGVMLVGEGQPYSAKRSEEHTSELQSLMRISYAVFCFKKKT